MSQVGDLGGGGWSGSSSGSAMPLRRFNRLPCDEAAELLRTCLSVERWVLTVVEARPFRRLDDLFEVARDAAFPFTPAELEAALARCPVTVVVPPARSRDSPSDVWIRQELEVGIDTYQRRFGRPFLISATGRPSGQLLLQLWNRLGNDIDAEDRVLAQQLRESALAQLASIIT